MSFLGWSLLCFVRRENHFAKAQVIFQTETCSRAPPEKSLSGSATKRHGWCVEMQSASPWIFTDYSHGVLRSKRTFEKYCQESSRIAFIHWMGVSIFIPVSVFARFDCVLLQPPVPNCQWMATKERFRGFLWVSISVWLNLTHFYSLPLKEDTLLQGNLLIVKLLSSISLKKYLDRERERWPFIFQLLENAQEKYAHLSLLLCRLLAWLMDIQCNFPTRI